MGITMFYSSTKPDKVFSLKISDITISGFTSTGTTTDEGKYVAPGSFTCQPSAPCKGIVLKDISHESKYSIPLKSALTPTAVQRTFRQNRA